jgi:hypothetical protein
MWTHPLPELAADVVILWKTRTEKNSWICPFLKMGKLTQLVEHLFYKCEALSSNPVPPKKKSLTLITKDSTQKLLSRAGSHHI